MADRSADHPARAPLTVVVVGAVFERDGEVLAFRRASGKASAGMWEFPGGKVEPGETPRRALIREIREELGIEVRVGELVDRSTTPSGDFLIDLSTFKTHPIHSFPFISSDHDEMRWISRAQLESVAWAPPDLPTVTALGRQPDHDPSSST